MSENLREQLTAAYEEVTTPDVVEPVVEEVIEEPVETEEPVEKETAPIEEEVIAPEHWAADDREVFKSLDKKGRDFLLRRHKEMEASHTRKLQALSEETRIAENFKKSIAPYESYLKQLNIDPNQAVEKLLSTEMRLRMASPQEKAMLMQDLAKQYGAALNPAEVPYVDPNMQAIFDELNKQKAYLVRQEQEKQEQHVRSLEGTIQSFASTKDDRGNLKYPHFESIRQDMGALINAGKAATLEDAYEKAAWMNAELRKELITRQYGEKKEENVKEKVAASKKAAFNVKSGSGSQIKEQKKTLSLRETLEQAMEAQQSRF